MICDDRGTTHKDKVEIGELIEHNALACRDAGDTGDSGQGQLHVLALVEEGIVGSDGSGDGLNVEEEGSVEPRKG